MLAAWWDDDTGNLALARGDASGALHLFERAHALAARSRIIEEDLGRAMLDVNPSAALLHFQSADCGAPCVAEEGDAQTRLGNARAAVGDYLRARAGPRLALTVRRMAARGQYDAAMSLERELIARLRGDPLYRADLAAAYESEGSLEAAAGYARPPRAAAYRRAAIESFRRATELAPFNEEYLLSYAFALLQWGDNPSARAAFERELVLHPHQPDAEKALQSLPTQPPDL